MGNYRIRIPEKDRALLVVDILFPYAFSTFTEKYIPPYCSISVPVERQGWDQKIRDIKTHVAY